MSGFAMKFAASGLILAMTMVGCRSDSAMLRSEWKPASETRSDRQALRLNEEAHRALQKGDLAGAMDRIEQAVALSPRDAGFRLLLADIYLKSGRYESARATYADVLDLDPGNVRAGMHYALIQVALGRPAAAVGQLDELAGRAAPADLGLAYALAGLPKRGIEILEPAARALRATPRVRQNLALAYALSGDWKRARVIAAQDVSPADLAARMQQWAVFTQPRQSWDQVASLLGVTPGEDPGQPERLALRSTQPEVRSAEVQPEVRTAGTGPHAVESHSIRLAEAAAVPFAPVSFEEDEEVPAEPAPVSAEERVRIRYASAAQTLVAPEPAVLQAAVEAAPPPPAFERRQVSPPNAVHIDPGRYVVQLGAFSNSENAERAWIEAERRFGLSAAQPLTTTIDWDGRVLHRVSVAGFQNRDAAGRLCGSIKAQGGECFVREIAGDAPIRWAARYVRNA